MIKKGGTAANTPPLYGTVFLFSDEKIRQKQWLSLGGQYDR